LRNCLAQTLPCAKLLFLLNYSPDLNPIEQVLAKLRQLLRKAAARTLSQPKTEIRVKARPANVVHANDGDSPVETRAAMSSVTCDLP
jgi:hypothetical protein